MTYTRIVKFKMNSSKSAAMEMEKVSLKESVSEKKKKEKKTEPKFFCV